MMDKHPLQIANEKRMETDTCPHCGFHNQTPDKPGEKKFRLYGQYCKGCGKALDHSYIFAPWGHTWEGLQAIHDMLEEKGFRGFRQPRKENNG
ncbi:MAG: hypothetical protein ACXW1D_00545 [Halobacteriota archaeon]